MISSTFPRLLIALGCLLLPARSMVGQEARDRAVEIQAIIRQAPPRISLRWNAPSTTPLLSQKVYRRSQPAEDWVELASLPLTATRYSDDAVTVGAGYEYFVSRVYDGPPNTATGWISAGIRAAVTLERGKVILLVDDTMAGPLATELAQYISDLNGDGWTVVRQDVSRGATVPSVRAIVQGIYQADPANTTTLILFGRIPVPYAGNIAPDGHPDHEGAWPADVYYGDVDGDWTDTTVNTTSASADRNRNIPGDGKFDQSTLPSDVDLEVGRIDLSNMPVFGVSEQELLRQYLVRNHQFRHRLGSFSNVPRRGLIDDNFGYFGGEAFASSGWRNFASLFGSANVNEHDWFSTLSVSKYLCAYGCGAGSYTSAGGVGTTGDFAGNDTKAVFAMFLGSYFGDWDVEDNFLRAPLGGRPDSLGLASVWAGRPHWAIHPMGLGATIGCCARLAQNNPSPLPAGYEAGEGARGVHIALMGDPTLRLHPVRPPTSIVAKPGANMIRLSWTSGGDGPVAGYIVSRATSPLGPYFLMRGAVARGTTFVDRDTAPGVGYSYMVRAVKRESTSSGSYLNPSQGIFSQPVTSTVEDGPEINVEGNGQPIVDGETVARASNGTDFGAVEIGQPALVHTFIVRNPGTVALTISNTPVSGTDAEDFVVTGVPSVVAAGGSATFDVSFQPSAPGSRRARLTLRNNDTNEAAFAFALGGSGVAAH